MTAFSLTETRIEVLPGYGSQTVPWAVYCARWLECGQTFDDFHTKEHSRNAYAIRTDDGGYARGTPYYALGKPWLLMARLGDAIDGIDHVLPLALPPRTMRVPVAVYGGRAFVPPWLSKILWRARPGVYDLGSWRAFEALLESEAEAMQELWLLAGPTAVCETFEAQHPGVIRGW